MAGLALVSVLLSAIASAITPSAIITIAALSFIGWLIFNPKGRQKLAWGTAQILGLFKIKIPASSAVPATGAPAATPAASPAAHVATTSSGLTLDMSRVPTVVLEAESFYRSFDTSQCDIRLRFVSDALLEAELLRRIHATP